MKPKRAPGRPQVWYQGEHPTRCPNLACRSENNTRTSTTTMVADTGMVYRYRLCQDCGQHWVSRFNQRALEREFGAQWEKRGRAQ